MILRYFGFAEGRNQTKGIRPFAQGSLFQRIVETMSSRKKKPDARALFKQVKIRKLESGASASVGRAAPTKYHGMSKEQVRKARLEIYHRLHYSTGIMYSL